MARKSDRQAGITTPILFNVALPMCFPFYRLYLGPIQSRENLLGGGTLGAPLARIALALAHLDAFGTHTSSLLPPNLSLYL